MITANILSFPPDRRKISSYKDTDALCLQNFYRKLGVKNRMEAAVLLFSKEKEEAPSTK